LTLYCSFKLKRQYLGLCQVCRAPSPSHLQLVELRLGEGVIGEPRADKDPGAINPNVAKVEGAADPRRQG
jgi:hypothetical protein